MADPQEELSELRNRLSQVEMLLSLFWLAGSDLDDAKREQVNRLLERLNAPDRARISELEVSRILSSLPGNVRPGPIVISGEQTFQQWRELSRATRDMTDNAHAALTAAQGQIKSAIEQAKMFKATVEQLETGQRSLQDELHSLLAAQTLGVDIAQVPLHRFVPLRVYLAEVRESNIEEVTSAVDHVARAFGFVITDDYPAIRSSLFKKWLARTVEVASQPEVAERLKKLERAVELQTLQAPQADIDQKQASAVAKMIKALKQTPSAALQVGSILLVKVPTNGKSAIHVRTLTQQELLMLEKNQHLLSSPDDILQKLAEKSGSQDPAPPHKSEAVVKKPKKKDANS